MEDNRDHDVGTSAIVMSLLQHLRLAAILANGLGDGKVNADYVEKQADAIIAELRNLT